MYLDPPYNQHRYFTNYHVWETLVRWDEPAHYGIACKRVDARDDSTRSVFNSKQEMPAAMGDLIARARADVRGRLLQRRVVDQPRGDDRGPCATAGRECVEVVAFDSKRYVGAQIGVHGPTGEKVGEVKRLRNVEYLFLAGERRPGGSRRRRRLATRGRDGATLDPNTPQCSNSVHVPPQRRNNGTL